MLALAGQLWARAASLAVPAGAVAGAWVPPYHRPAPWWARACPDELEPLADPGQLWTLPAIDLEADYRVPLRRPPELDTIADELMELAALDAWAPATAAGVRMAANHVRGWAP